MFTFSMLIMKNSLYYFTLLSAFIRRIIQKYIMYILQSIVVREFIDVKITLYIFKRKFMIDE